MRQSETDHLAMSQTATAVRQDVKHACPECPSPVATVGLVLAPSVFCPYCRGSGLLTTAELARWQREHA